MAQISGETETLLLACLVGLLWLHWSETARQYRNFATLNCLIVPACGTNPEPKKTWLN